MSDPVLVTGAEGLLGTALLPLLRQRSDANIFASSRTQCDLTSATETSSLLRTLRPATIIHLAGGTSSDPIELHRRNVQTTANLFEAASHLTPMPYCVVLGSAGEYGHSDERISETHPLSPVSEYGRAKREQTNLAESISRTTGLPLTILRPFNVYSSRMSVSTALGGMRDALLRGSGSERSVACGRLDLVRDFISADDVARVIQALIDDPLPGETLNVCSGTGIALNDVLAAMAAILGVTVRVMDDPLLMAIPAPLRVVGDPSKMVARTSVTIEVTAERVASALLDHPR